MNFSLQVFSLVVEHVALGFEDFLVADSMEARIAEVIPLFSIISQMLRVSDVVPSSQSPRMNLNGVQVLNKFFFRIIFLLKITNKILLTT